MPSPISLPVDWLVQTLDLDGALRLVKAFGGCEVYVCSPSHLRPGNQIAEAIGMERARKLCTEFAQLDVRVPRLVSELRRMRVRAVHEDRKAGLTMGAIATKYSVTIRTVQLDLAEPIDEPRTAPREDQLQLF